MIVDISSAEPGSEAGEPKPLDTAKASDHMSEPEAVSANSKAPDPIVLPDNKIDLPDNKEVTKVLAYGPAERAVEAPEVKAPQASESGEAPEIKADKIPPLGAMSDAAKTAPSFGSALVPFIGKEKEGLGPKTAAKPRPPRSGGFQSYGMMAAGFAAFIGVAWAAAGAFYSPQTIKAPAAVQAAATVPPAAVAAAPESSEARRLTEEIRLLKKELDGLRTAIAQNPAPEELRSLKKSVDAVKNNLEATKCEVGSLSGKLDRAQHDAAKLRELSHRLDHMEHAALLPSTTASVAPQESATRPAQVPAPPAKAQTSVQAPAQPQTVASRQSQAPTPAAPASAEKPLIANWVVRDVYDGIALVEGPHGAMEVIEGETIPGIGMVKSIERRGSGWIVLTSRGQLDSARD